MPRGIFSGKLMVGSKVNKTEKIEDNLIRSRKGLIQK